MKSVVVIMGVSGSGKSAVGKELAARLGLPFVEGDTLHPPSNVEKMRSGRPLNDEDRAPWLAAVGKALAQSSSGGLIMACSALKRSYRDEILRFAPTTVFVHLDVPRRELATRLANRPGHFMPAALLDSQLATLEPIDDDEPGVTMNGTDAVGAIVGEVAAWLRDSAVWSGPA
jgi:gluconokinase